MAKWLLTPLVLVALAAASYGAWRYMQPVPTPDGILYANGHVEGTEIDVSSELAARVVAANFEEGVAVPAGGVLAQLDDDTLRVRRREIEAQRRALAASMQRIEAELATARHHRQTAAVELDRLETLAGRGQASRLQLDQARNADAEARGRVGALTAQVAELRARGKAVAGQADEIGLQLAKATIRAPRAGTVLVKGVEAGELAAPGQLIARLVDLNRLELKVFVAESDLGRIKLGAPAQVKVSAFPDRRFEARVSSVDQRAQFTPRDIHMPSERVRMVFGVTLALANPDGQLKPGMPADAWIRWRERAQWPARLTVPR